MKILPRPSPNYNHRPPGAVVDCVVLHATESDDTQQDVAWLDRKHGTSSAHVVIDRDGTVYALVAPELRAWHAGVSSFMGREDVNTFSIGVEFANDCDHAEPFTEEQYGVGAQLIAGYMRQFPAITLERITRHSDVALPLGRKSDPGKMFDMAKFLTLVQAARLELAQDGAA